MKEIFHNWFKEIAAHKGKAVNSWALHLSLAKIQEIFRKCSG